MTGIIKHKDFLRSFLVYFTLFILSYNIMNSGGKDPFTQNFSCLMAAIVFFISLYFDPDNSEIKVLRNIYIFCFFILVLYISIQSVRLMDHPFENYFYSLTREKSAKITEEGEIIRGAISIYPEKTFGSMVTLAPFLVFIAILTFIKNAHYAIKMLRFLAYLCGLIAVIGLLQHIFAPTWTGFVEKQFYIGSLTAFFINRNSAGSFLGLNMLLAAGLSYYYTNMFDVQSFKKNILNKTRFYSREEKYFIFFFFMAIIHFLALILTQSRGAFLSTLLGGLTFVSLIALRASRNSVSDAPHRSEFVGWGGVISPKTQKWMKYLIPFVFLVLVFLLFGGVVTHRLASNGVDAYRVCVYQATVSMFFDHFWWGTGFATFAELFPAYRDRECLGITETWDMAHNTYLEAFASLGVIFLPLLLVMVGSMGWLFYKGWKRKSRRYMFAPILGFSLLVLALAHSMTDFSLQIPGVAFYLSIVLANLSHLSVYSSH